MEKLKEFLNKQAVGFYISALAALLILLTAIVYIANSTHLYYTDFELTYLLGIVGAFVLMVGTLVLSQFIGNSKFLTIAFLGAVLILGFIAFYFINGRVETIAFVFASDLESNNPYAQFATRQAIFAFSLFIASWLTVIIASFFKTVKE